MTDDQIKQAEALANEARLDAKAFRENTVYTGDGDPIRLVANADRLDQYSDTIAALVAEVRRLRDASANRKQFPILGTPGVTVDWQLVHDHGRRAKANHFQTVERLAERGGLSWGELHAVLHNRAWQMMDENTAITECRAIEARYLAALENHHD